MGNQPPRKGFCLRVTDVAPGSPAAAAELQPYTDLVVSVLGVPENFDLVSDFFRFATENEDKEIRLMVHCLLTGIQRIVILTPSSKWPNANSLTGARTRVEELAAVTKSTFRISGVRNHDLHDRISLNHDFFLGVKEFTFSDLEDLKNKLFGRKFCTLIVYSCETFETRFVSVSVTDGLGLEFSIGVLHNLTSVYQKCMLVKLNKEKLRERARELGIEDSENGEHVIVYKDGVQIDLESLLKNEQIATPSPPPQDSNRPPDAVQESANHSANVGTDPSAEKEQKFDA